MNPFEALAEAQIAAPKKARMRAAEKRAEARNAALQERDTLLADWKRWRKEQVDLLLNGTHGAQAKALVNFLGTMTLEGGPKLVALVMAGPWRQADRNTRFEVLHLVGMGIAKIRERAGMAPFDDSLPGEEPTCFEQIREWLR